MGLFVRFGSLRFSYNFFLSSVFVLVLVMFCFSFLCLAQSIYYTLQFLLFFSPSSFRFCVFYTMSPFSMSFVNNFLTNWPLDGYGIRSRCNELASLQMTNHQAHQQSKLHRTWTLNMKSKEKKKKKKGNSMNFSFGCCPFRCKISAIHQTPTKSSLNSFFKFVLEYVYQPQLQNRNEHKRNRQQTQSNRQKDMLL